jgi:hypothetical protein
VVIGLAEVDSMDLKYQDICWIQKRIQLLGGSK